MGAKLLIIADQSDEFDSEIMNDDKSGVHLRIPTIMIANRDAKLIKDEIKLGVAATYEIAHPNRNKFVEIEFWFGIFSTSSYPFLISFLNFLYSLNEINQQKFIFVPKFELLYCYSCKRGNYTSDD